MKIIHIISTAALLSMSLAVQNVAAKKPIISLCKPDEGVVWSCRVGTKSVSLCAVPGATLAPGSLHYRYGKPGQTPELEYPSDSRPVTDAFTYFNPPDGAKNSAPRIEFRQAGYRYVLFENHAAFPLTKDDNSAGIRVYSGDKVITQQNCATEEFESNLAGFGYHLDYLEPVARQEMNWDTEDVPKSSGQ